MEENTEVLSGPKAPKDPQTKRSSIYIMLDQMIQSVERSDGSNTSEIYLDNERLMSKAEVVGSVTDKEIINMLTTCEGFHKLVHSIGVTISDAGDTDEIIFGLMNYGKVEKYAGSRFEMSCKTNGMEQILDTSSLKFTQNDDVVGQCYFDFGKRMSTAKVTVKLYLNNGYEVPDLEVDTPVEWDSEKLNMLIKKSLVQTGNVYRLQKAIQKAKSGEDVTIAFIGGSITQGAGAVPNNTECYAYKTYTYFREMFCSNPKKCHFVKAGIGGTSSELGVIRYELDVENFGAIKPDLVIVEFAVNDEGDETKGDCHESLIYHILEDERQTAVIMLFSVFANDWNLQGRLQPIGENYDLPMVSMSNALVEQFKKSKEQENVITKRQYFYDVFHPTNTGHTVMALCLKHLFQTIEKLPECSADLVLEKGAAIGRSYTRIHFFDRSMENLSVMKNLNKTWKVPVVVKIGGFSKKDEMLQSVERNDDTFQTPQFPYNWMHDMKLSTEPFVMRVNSRGLFLIVKDSDDISFGKAEVYLDDELVKTYDPHEVGWTHCNALLIYSNTCAKEHVVKVLMAAGEEDKKFTILGFGVVN